MIIYDVHGNEVPLADYVARFPREGILARHVLPSGHRIETLWVGVDDRLERSGPPEIFETLVTGPAHDDRWHGHRVRYATVTDAVAGHLDLVRLLDEKRTINAPRLEPCYKVPPT